MSQQQQHQKVKNQKVKDQKQCSVLPMELIIGMLNKGGV